MTLLKLKCASCEESGQPVHPAEVVNYRVHFYYKLPILTNLTNFIFLQKAKMAHQHTVTNTIYNRCDNMVNELLQSKSVYVWWF